MNTSKQQTKAQALNSLRKISLYEQYKSRKKEANEVYNVYTKPILAGSQHKNQRNMVQKPVSKAVRSRMEQQ